MSTVLGLQLSYGVMLCPIGINCNIHQAIYCFSFALFSLTHLPSLATQALHLLVVYINERLGRCFSSLLNVLH